MIKRTSVLFGLACAAGITVAPGQAQEALAQNCNYCAGTASTGASVNVDLCSISIASSQSVDFVYYLDETQIYSQVNCAEGYWTTFPEGDTHRPQSQATQNMLTTVCSYLSSNTSNTSDAGAAFVFDPPSNVRESPNGDILCSVQRTSTINIYGSTGEWYYTDVCGSMGVIHSSQIRF